MIKFGAIILSVLLIYFSLPDNSLLHYASLFSGIGLFIYAVKFL